jgi:uncharacterized membrane protein
MRWIMAVFYGLAGVAHVTSTDKFLLIAPDWVPFPRAVVLVTGLCEIAGSIALFGTRFRRSAGIMLALYAVCVFPATSSTPSKISICRRCPTAGGIMDHDWHFSRCWCGGPCSAPA